MLLPVNLAILGGTPKGANELVKKKKEIKIVRENNDEIMRQIPVSAPVSAPRENIFAKSKLLYHLRCIEFEAKSGL